MNKIGLGTLVTVLALNLVVEPLFMMLGMKLLGLNITFNFITFLGAMILLVVSKAKFQVEYTRNG